MAFPLVLLSLWACSHAQIIYPDQYEMMKTSTIPSFIYQTSNRETEIRPNQFRNTAYAAPASINAEVQLSPQKPVRLGVAQVSEVYQQTYSTTQAGLNENTLHNWADHVNNIITRGITKFALDVEREIQKGRSGSPVTERENVVFSPISIAMTLAMVLLGSAGRTFDEVSRVLGLEAGVDISRNSEVVHQMFGLLLNLVHNRIMADSPGPRINFASGIFVQDGFSIRPEFRAISENVYRSEVINLDFLNNGKQAQNVINDWVKQRTMEKISSILSDVPRPETNVILISALYFNGEWNQHFLTGATKRRPFFIEPNESIDVDMMYNAGIFPFYEDKQLNVKIVDLPYKGHEVSMYVLLPGAQGAAALRNFVKTLTPEILENLINNTKNETCVLGLPRMKLSSTLTLSSVLKSLGLTSLFNPAIADLSLLSQGHTGQVTSPTRSQSSPVVAALRMTPSPIPSTRPGKSSTEAAKPTVANDLFIFPRFGEDDQTPSGSRRNYFSYEDKIRGLTVEQWSTGFSIGKTRRSRRHARNGRRAFQERLEVQRAKTDEENKDTYVVNQAEQSNDNTKVVNLEHNKYRFESPRETPLRRKRQNRPINEDFLNYIKSQNFPSYGLDDLRNSANTVNPGLSAAEVLHKVEIDITEKGTEAAAVTAVVLERDGNQKRLVANRPFIFFIRHNPSKLMLFWGTLNTPTPNYPAM